VNGRLGTFSTILISKRISALVAIFSVLTVEPLDDLTGTFSPPVTTRLATDVPREPQPELKIPDLESCDEVVAVDLSIVALCVLLLLHAAVSSGLYESPT
jgi:hypothetical protein